MGYRNGMGLQFCDYSLVWERDYSLVTTAWYGNETGGNDHSLENIKCECLVSCCCEPAPKGREKRENKVTLWARPTIAERSKIPSEALTKCYCSSEHFHSLVPMPSPAPVFALGTRLALWCCKRPQHLLQQKNFLQSKLVTVILFLFMK